MSANPGVCSAETVLQVIVAVVCDNRAEGPAGPAGPAHPAL